MTQINPVSARALTPDQPLGQGAQALVSGVGGPGFADVLDIVNPLQHIPVVSTLYQEVTGDRISAAASVIGGALFGGIPGLIGSAANAALEAETGKNVGDTALSLLKNIGSDSNTAAYAPMGASSLEPDLGEGLLSIIQAAQSVEGASAALAPGSVDKPATATHLVDLYKNQDFSLGMEDTRKRTQLLSELDQTLLEMKTPSAHEQ